jgi:uroporphyrin-3 C-methyltransferase
VNQTERLPEPDSASAEVAAAAAAGARPAPRRGGGGWAFALILLVLSLLAGYYLWSELQRARDEARAGRDWQTEVQALEARLEALARRQEQVAGSQSQIDARVGELGSNQRVIRQELLGMGERATTIEEAVSRVSEQRLRGETLLKLNELEGLLTVAEQRLLLAADVEGAHLALALAANVLQAVDDPLYAGLALPLAAEREALQRAGADPLPSVRRTLEDGLAASAGLPPRRPAVEAEDVTAQDAAGRLQQALSRLVTVRRQGAADAVLGSAEAAALRSALELDLRTALLAAERRDGDALGAAIERALPAFDRLFDPQADAVQAWRARLAELAGTPLQRSLPALGQTLSELRALRGHRQRMQPESLVPGSAQTNGAPAVGVAPAAAGTAEASESIKLEPEADEAVPRPEPDGRRAPTAAPAPRA